MVARSVLCLVALLGIARSARSDVDLAARVLAEAGSTRFEVQRLEVPEGLPDRFTIRVAHAGRSDVLELQRRSLRVPGFKLRIWADGRTTTVDPPPPASYQGHVAGRPDLVAGGALTPRGLRLEVRAPDGGSWAVRPLADFDATAVSGRHVILESPGMPEGRVCGVADGAAADRPLLELVPAPAGLTQTATLGWCGPGWLKRTEIAFDVDQVYYRDLGSSIPAVTANIDAHLAAIDAFYQRDALITYVLTALIIRTTDFYLPAPTTGSLLDLFRTEWLTNQTAVPRDIAHLMTGQPAPGLAGLAYVGVVCNQSYHYGWSVDSSGVLGHEVGHNWNAGHCADVSPCNNMCGACLYIGPNTKAVIESFRDSRTCLDQVGPATAPLPPYATPDTLRITRDQALARTSVPVDVLANDHDANCDDLRIASFDAASRRGGTVALDAGGGPGGRDRLLYTAPCAPFSGLDTFTYTAGDGNGGTSTATVSVDIEDAPLASLWPLDEGAGTLAADVGLGRDGTVQNGAAWSAGRVGQALDLDGIDDHITVPALSLAGLPGTITAWVRRSGNLDPFSGIVYSRAAGTTAGLHVGNANDLRYTWSDDPATWGRSSGLVLPDGKWAFVALVVEPGQATIYLDDGSSWASWNNVLGHVPQTFAGETSFGRDPTGGRYFRGGLDEVRVIDAALPPAQLMALRDGTGPAEAPRPPDGGFYAVADGALTWRAPFGVTEFDVYLGRDLGAVRGATPASPDYQGRVAGTSFNPPGMFLESATYAWRVDAIVAGVPISGPPWLFTFRGRTPRLLGYWRFDEGTGTTAADASSSGLRGDLLNGAAWGSGVHAGALTLDGLDDEVVTAPLARPLDEITITAWIRSNGLPAPWAGLVFCRGGSTTMGLGFRDTNELGYHWAGGSWGWSSGVVVPTDQWVFVALALSPAQATVSLWDGTRWTAATDASNHGAEAFDAGFTFGRDPWGAPRSFGGQMDDVRIFDRALDATELDAIRLLAPRAMSPEPRDGETLALAPSRLAWVPGADVNSSDVYLGADLARVRVATPASPEFRGNVTGGGLPLVTLAPGSWYWRIDTRSGAAITTGDVWRFRVYEGAGASLRVRKTAGARPELSWSTADGVASFAVERCAPAVRVCSPLPVASVPGDVRSYVDPVAVEPLVWYEVAAEPCP